MCARPFGRKGKSILAPLVYHVNPTNCAIISVTEDSIVASEKVLPKGGDVTRGSIRGYTEAVLGVQGVWGKDQERVGAAIHRLRPFPLLGLDSDNGSELINRHLYTYISISSSR